MTAKRLQPLSLQRAAVLALEAEASVFGAQRGVVKRTNRSSTAVELPGLRLELVGSMLGFDGSS